MPNIQSAKKRTLVIQKKNLQNRTQMSELKTTVKKFHEAIDVNDIKLAEQLLPETFSIIDSCCQKGIIHKNNAANKKSAIAKRLSDGFVEIDPVQIKLRVCVFSDHHQIPPERGLPHAVGAVGVNHGSVFRWQVGVPDENSDGIG